MGADAIGFVISAALPEQLPVSWVESLYEGIRECCSSYRVNLLGGDVTGSPGGVIQADANPGAAIAKAIKVSVRGLRTVMVLSLDLNQPSAICRDYAFRHGDTLKNRVRQGANSQITNS